MQIATSNFLLPNTEKTKFILNSSVSLTNWKKHVDLKTCSLHIILIPLRKTCPNSKHNTKPIFSQCNAHNVRALHIRSTQSIQEMREKYATQKPNYATHAY